MTRFDGSTALILDFGAVTTTAFAGRGRAGLRLAATAGAPQASNKYKVLEHRRRRAQIKARHLLELMEEAR